MKPYYEHAGITIYHGRIMVDCDAWTPTKEPADTAPASVARPYQRSSRGRNRATGRQPSTSNGGPAGVKITTLGRGMT